MILGSFVNGLLELFSECVTISGGNDPFAQPTLVTANHQLTVAVVKGIHPMFGTATSSFGNRLDLLQGQSSNRHPEATHLEVTWGDVVGHGSGQDEHGCSKEDQKDDAEPYRFDHIA